MPTDESRPIYRGLLVPDPRSGNGLWEAESSFTAAGAQPGIPVPGRPTDLILRASGAPDTDIEGLDVLAVRNGFPARDLGARVAIRRSGRTPEEEWAGHWNPTLMSSRELINQTTVAPGTFLKNVNSNVAAMPGGGVIACWSGEFGATEAEVLTAYRSKDGIWTENGAAFGQVGLGSNGPPHAAVVPLPTGRILMVVWVGNNAANGSFDLYVSDDLGVSWQLSARTITSPLSVLRFTLQKLRALYGGPGEVLLVGSFLDNGSGVPWTPLREQVLLQFASADLGASFQLIYAQDGLGVENADPDAPEPQEDWLRSGTSADIIADRNGFLVVYSDPNLGFYPTVRRLPSAYSSFGSAPASYILAQPTWESDIAAIGDTNGTAWVIFRSTVIHGSDIGFLFGVYSSDAGAHWTPAPDITNYEGVLTPFDSTANHYTLHDLAGAWDRGRVVLLHRTPDAGGWVQSLYALINGGWAAPPAPITGRTPGSLGSQASSEISYIPMNLPTTLGWTANGTSGAQSYDGFKLSVTGLVGEFDARGYLRDTGLDVSGSLLLDARATNGQMSARITILDEFQTTSWSVHIAIKADGTVALTAFELSPYASYTFPQGPGRIQVAIGVSAEPEELADPRYGCWARWMGVDGDAPIDYDPEWVLVGEGALFADIGVSAQSYVEFGSFSVNGFPQGGNDGEWFQVIHRKSLGEIWANGRPETSEIQGRAMTVIPVHARDGLFLSARGGPGFTGDTWEHTPLFDFGADNLSPLTSRSPSQGWQATVLGDASFAYDLMAGVEQDTMPETAVFGVHVTKTNHPTWRLEFYNEFTDSWDVAADFDTRDWFGLLDATGFGDAVALDSGWLVAPVDGAVGYYIAPNELEGGTLYADDVAFSIRSNTGGLVAAALDRDDTVPPRVFIDGETTLLGAGSLSVRVAPPSWTLLVRTDGFSSGEGVFRGVRVTAVRDPLAPTNEPLPRAGSIVIGSGYVFGMDYDLSKTYVRRAAVEVDEDASGQVYTRKRGPTKRGVNVQWQTGGIWTRGVFDIDVVGGDEFVRFSDAVAAWPTALLHADPMLIDGLVDALDGPHVPVVLLQDIPRLVDPATWVLLARTRAGGSLYSHLGGSISFGADAGEYGKDQKFTMSFDVSEEV